MASGKFSLHASFRGPLGIPLHSLLGPRSSYGVEGGTSGFLSRAKMDLRVLLEFPPGKLRPLLMWRHARLLSLEMENQCQASFRVDIGIGGFLSRCLKGVIPVIMF